MCRDCGCSLGPAAARAPFAAQPATKGHIESIEVITAILDENDRVAAHNRTHFDGHGVLAVNLMSSPGSGKTSLLEATIKALQGELRIAVIEGDLATENDAARIRACGVPAIQITTAGGICAVLDLALRHPEQYRGFVRQEQFPLNQVLANRFGRYYSDGAGKEVSSRIIAAGSRGQQRLSTK